MARGRAAPAVTLLDFFKRRSACDAGDQNKSSDPAIIGDAIDEEVSPAVCTDLAALPPDVSALCWALCGPPRCCAVRQCSRALKKACPADLAALKHSLGLWALSVVDMSALRPVGERGAQAPAGPSSASRLGRWGDFALVTDGAGNGFMRGPALLRCTHRWRLRARSAQLLALGQQGDAHGPLHEVLRRSAMDAGAEGSVHASGSVWDDAATGRPRKRRRVQPLYADAAERPSHSNDGDEGGCLFSPRRWDALMDPRVPWRLRVAALMYHHHGGRGCTHAATRAAAAAFVHKYTRSNDRLRSTLLDALDA